ncbi:type IV pilus modification PilV family protein [Halalkalibacter urbisdiaboli]|uniref:type IV pilus modification PilV family protein n=1 Tax=Halalkalibacter urbisdiaboli TaxID=1960589 RepID=UPI000B43E97A|nr:type II secretion system protein [Halalkalibacter urbisdiaboli]
MQNEKGLTLVELLVSVVILAMVLVPLLTIMSGTSTRTASQARETENAYLAQEIIEKIRMNEGVYKVTSDDGYYCSSLNAHVCTGHVPLNPTFEAELQLNEGQVVEIIVIDSPENAQFNEVSVIVRNNDRVMTGPEDGVHDIENRIELATVVRK